MTGQKRTQLPTIGDSLVNDPLPATDASKAELITEQPAEPRPEMWVAVGRDGYGWQETAVRFSERNARKDAEGLSRVAVFKLPGRR